MSYKGETEPLITHTAVPEGRPGWSRLRFYLALGLCFVLLTGSWHAFSWFSRPHRDVSADWPPRCGGSWVSQYGSWSISPEKGVAVTHRHGHRYGHDSRVNHKDRVHVEATSKDEIYVIINVKAKSKTLANAINISLHGNELIIDTDEIDSAGRHDCVELDIRVQIPSKATIPFLNLSLIASEVYIMDPIKADIDSINISTLAGSIFTESSLLANTTSISTHAGFIKGRYTLVKNLSLRSTAGGIDVEVVVDTRVTSRKARFLTQTSAGSTHVNLLPPLKHRNQIAARHHSSAGSVTLIYPQEWEGVVEAETSAGSLRLSGEGLEIVESRGGFGPNRCEKAVKGDDWESKSMVDVSTSAGSCSFALE